jgi:hypothetical protein
MDLFFGWRKDKKIVPARECCQPGKGYLLNYLYRGIIEVPKSIYCNRHQIDWNITLLHPNQATFGKGKRIV